MQHLRGFGRRQRRRDEQYEGTRIRLENATVLTEPVQKATGPYPCPMTCWESIRTTPSGNEDPDGPTPGDVYQIYGASHQNGDAYVLHVGDIDGIARGFGAIGVPVFCLNPVTDALTIQAGSGVSDAAMISIRIFNASGRLVLEERTARRMTLLDINSCPQASIPSRLWKMRHQKPAICRSPKAKMKPESQLFFCLVL